MSMEDEEMLQHQAKEKYSVSENVICFDSTKPPLIFVPHFYIIMHRLD